MKKLKISNPPLKTRKTEFSCYNLKELLNELEKEGITDFKKVEFEISYEGCYYESDPPSIAARYTPPRKNAKSK